MGFTKTYHCCKFMFIFLFDIAARTLTIITQIVYAGNAMCGKLVIHRCIRTKLDVPTASSHIQFSQKHHTCKV